MASLQTSTDTALLRPELQQHPVTQNMLSSTSSLKGRIVYLPRSQKTSGLLQQNGPDSPPSDALGHPVVILSTEVDDGRVAILIVCLIYVAYLC